MQNRRELFTVAAGAAVLGLTGCSAVSTAVSTAATTVNTLAITTVSQATTFWASVKGVAQVAAAAVSLANPALGAALTAAINVGDILASGLSTTAADATSVTNAIAALVQHGAALVTQALAATQVTPNGVTTAPAVSTVAAPV